MQIYTLPALAEALGVTYPVVYALRARGFLEPTQVNGSLEYYTLENYALAAARSVEEWKDKRASIARPQSSLNKTKQHNSNRINYDALFK